MCIGHIFQPSDSWQALYMAERQSNNKTAIFPVNCGRNGKYMILMKGDWLTQAQDKKKIRVPDRNWTHDLKIW